MEIAGRCVSRRFASPAWDTWRYNCHGAVTGTTATVYTNSRSCKKAMKVAVLNASQGRAGYTAYTGWPARSW